MEVRFYRQNQGLENIWKLDFTGKIKVRKHLEVSFYRQNQGLENIWKLVITGEIKVWKTFGS